MDAVAVWLSARKRQDKKMDLFSAKDTTRWAKLRPWCRYLKGRLSVEYVSEDPLCGASPRSRLGGLVLTINEYLTRMQLGDIKKLREAIELVGLALVLDNGAWDGVVRGLCGVENFSPANHSLEELQPRLTVRHVVTGSSKFNTVELFHELWVHIEHLDLSKPFWRTREWLLREFGSSGRSADTSVLPVTLQCTPFRGELESDNERETYCARLLAFVQAFRASSMTESMSPCGFVSRLASLELNLEAIELTKPISLLVTKIIQTRLRLDLLALQLGSSEASAELVGFLTSLEDDTIKLLRLSDSPRAPTSSVLELLQLSKSIRRVELGSCVLDVSPPRRQKRAICLASSLLSKNAASSIQSLGISQGALGHGDIQAMVEFLSQNDSPRHNPTDSNGLRSFTLGFPQFSIHDVLRLLVLIGQTIESLTLDATRWEVQDDQIHALLRACPQLRRLRIQRAQFQSLDGFAQAYSNGECRLEALCFEDVGISNKESVLGLVQAASSPPNGYLREFACDVYLRSPEVEALLSLLKDNSTLQYVSFRLSEPCLRHFQSDIQALHLAPLPKRQGPLRAKSKLAFLSVIQRAAVTTSGKNLAIGHVTDDMVESIFEFAAECVCRKVMCYTTG